MTSSILGQADLALPGERTVVDLVGMGDGRVATSVVHEVSGDEIVMTMPEDSAHHPVRPESGARLELVWKEPEGLLALPVEVIGIESADPSQLRVRRTGPAVPGQRRDAVRAPLVLPVQLTRGREQLTGLTLDISEGGLRCVLDGPTEPTTSAADADAVDPAEKLAVGEEVAVVVTLDNAVVEGRAVLVRRHGREDGRSQLSLRFVELPEVTQDLIRRQVFASLRDLRLRGLI
jgi:hypothetical protein